MVSNNKSIQVRDNCKIYIMSPAKIATGGPEALHQLAYVLKNSLKLSTFIHYIPTSDDNPIHKNYEIYSVKLSKEIQDSPENILVIPEYFEFLNIAKKFKNIQKIIWWLSIDNYFGYRFRFKNLKTIRSIIKIPFNLINFFNYFTLNFFGLYTSQDYLKFIYKFTDLKKHQELSQGKVHLAQSKYAFDFLSDKFRNVDFLSDYIRDDFFDNINFNKKEKQNCICFNPMKSNSFMNRIINRNNKIKFIPLIGLTKNQVIDSLKKSKIYFDIGSHPGKDRMPREAALLGNCVITNRRGSARNREDIFIPEEFKFEEKLFNLNKINNKIISIFDNYEKEYEKFSPYINNILQEKKIFISQTQKIFQNK